MAADIVVIGTGFGGAVVARRLAQANQTIDRALKIVLLERGRRYEATDFPRPQLPDYLTNDQTLQSSKRLPEVSRLSWTYDQGLWQIRDLRGLRVAVAAGYGGGSLIYASVHLRPPASVFQSWPEPYDRNTLDPYYALVEAMLDARPAPATFTKTARMTAVAQSLGREQSLFRPPIAVTFDPPGTPNDAVAAPADNGFGVNQSGCIGCGDCIIGCPHGAKNTLDRNYLAAIEDLGVRVRTMSEAIAIEPSDDAPSRFRVCYRDHLRGSQEYALDARYVFVCGGAIGSTELLLRSRKALKAAWAAPGLDQLGEQFFANGDAPGVIFDTNERWGPSEGPTITTSLYHAEGEEWFLLQDGGIPASLQRGLGFLQSPLWLGRNAFGELSGAASPAPSFFDDSPKFAEALTSLPRISKAFAALATGRPVETPPSMLLPASVRKLINPYEPPGEAFLRGITSLDDAVVNRFAGFYQNRLWLLGRALAAAIRWVGHFKALPAATIDELVGRFTGLASVSRSSSTVGLGFHGLLDVLLGPAPTEHTAILLAMGPDSRWKLEWHELSRQLSATGDDGKNVALYGLQERLMRDITHSLGGELRTNPGWTLGHHPLTVHSQGGCSMSNGAPGVTNPDGLEVLGVDGLYVFDGSVFPTSVGVNPSSTIAAVAERNIERFIQTTLAKEYSSELQRWTAKKAEIDRRPEFERRIAEKQQQWEEGPGRILDDPQHQPKAATVPVPGLRWDEALEGFFGEVQKELQKRVPAQQPPNDLDAGGFRDFEREGQRSLRHVRAELTATLADLEAALLHPARSDFQLRGTLHIAWGVTPAGRPRERYEVTAGRLVIDLNAANAIGSLTYVLDASSPNSGERLHLVGVKQLRDDPGLDAWKDLTTLYTTITRTGGGSESTYAGILHVPLLDILGTQLPSMDVVGDDISAARKSWLLSRFLREFFRGLEGIYTIGDL